MIDVWNEVVKGFEHEGFAQTEWVFDMDGYTWVGDMLVYEEDLAGENEIDGGLELEYVM